MRVVYGIGRIKLTKKSCVAVGVFDGLHLGHQSIIKKVVKIARKRHLLSVILTFFPHPDSIVHTGNKSPLLISLRHRIGLIKSFGVDVCVIVKFSKTFRNMNADKFISEILIKRYAMKELVVSKSFIFGKNHIGNFLLINELSKKFNFKVYFQPEIRINKKAISSTLIRSLIRRGDLGGASRLLGRQVEVVGTVIGGDSRGRKLGFPTANIDPHHEVIPPGGVYIIEAWLNNEKIFGLANIGSRPTFKKEEKEVVEIHLLNFRKDIYGRELKIVFIKKLRCEKKFRYREHLINQINTDIRKAKSFFSA
jgi:riboflavin kinase/FMN adenylyltransferase